MTDTHNPRKARRQIPAETKLQILKEARSTNLSLSQVCEQYAISPTLFYQWEQIANRGALSALQGQPRGRKKVRPSEEALHAEVERLREVIAEITSENLQLKRGRWR
jgi:transposase-like protein